MKRVDAEILTVDDLAELFSCEKETAAARLTSGDLPGVKVGRGWIIPRQALFERLNEKAREEAAARREENKIGSEHFNQKNNKKPINESNNPRAQPSSQQAIFSMPTKLGRKRRKPPELPRLNEIALAK